jgi:hypothetical protein
MGILSIIFIMSNEIYFRQNPSHHLQSHIILFIVLASLRVVTKEGYRYVLISKSFHSVSKEKAECEQTSVWKYIQVLVENGCNTTHNRAATGSNPVRPILTLKPL